ncbi:MAG: NAD-dependent epimerase [Candidatus Lambdaproteobacteria bacterium]|nr:NAD-dependent epimerase [Candidatus Lambdaproteobacteria bacterium]
MKILVTGTAGFIGNNLALRLLNAGHEVVGLDNVNPYYDVSLKEARLKRIAGHPHFHEARLSLEDAASVAELFARHKPERVVHLAAQAGVRYSIEHPQTYIDSNVTGFLNILEGCRRHPVEHLVFASTSSVYGLSTAIPFSTRDATSHPVSLYAATKKANELMAHNYSHLFGVPATGLRFFTVYGPWGRPDMALFLFTRAILAGEPIQVFNHGDMQRDFTYVDDIVEGVTRILNVAPQPDPAWDSGAAHPARSSAPFRLYNIGAARSIRLTDFIDTLEQCLGRKAQRVYLPMQPGDVPATQADVKDLQQVIGYSPQTTIDVGVRNFVTWYRGYFGVE